MRTFTFKSLFLTVLFMLLGSTAILAAGDGLITRQITIKLDEAGTLPDRIGENQKYLITNLKIVGKINGTDLKFIREMAGCDFNGKKTDELIKGRKVVVNAWFSGCGPCLREMPILSEWKEQLPDVLFLSVNFEKADKVRRITQQRGFNWNHIYDDKYFVRFVGTGGFPLFLVLDEKGIVRYVGNGTNDSKRAEIQKLIKSL